MLYTSYISVSASLKAKPSFVLPLRPILNENSITIVLGLLAHLVEGPSASVALGLDLCTISLCRVSYLMLVRAGLMHNVFTF